MTGELAHILGQLLVASQHLTATHRQAARLSPLEYAAVLHLTRAPRGLTPTQLAERLGVTSGSTTKLVDRLADRHLANRTRDRSDRRSLSIKPTPKAATIAEHHARSLVTALAPITASLGKAEEVAIVNYLTQAVARLEAAACNPEET
jgi:DNA-binding MarR family transcriptional regulator